MVLAFLGRTQWLWRSYVSFISFSTLQYKSGILELVRTHFDAAGGEEFPPFSRLNFLSENFGGQEFGKAVACPVAPPKADVIGEPHRCLPRTNSWYKYGFKKL